MIFFISIIFRQLYFPIQFGWALNYSSLLVIGCRFTLGRKGYDNHHCHYKLPDRKCSWSVDDVMPGRDGPENLRILKKSQLKVEIGPWNRVVGESAIESKS